MIKNVKDLRIVFMGTPDFAVASLRVLVDAGCHVVGVITAPDKQAGRGLQLQQSAVKKYALEKGLHILQPEKLKNEDFLANLKALNADIQAVVAFRMLPELVWNMPPMGTVNVHGSLLPNYRGAAPINWAVINGEKITGVTTFKLKQAIDTGNILLTDSVTIEEEDTAGTVHDKLMIMGAALLLKALIGLVQGSIVEKEQEVVGKEELGIGDLELGGAVGKEDLGIGSMELGIVGLELGGAVGNQKSEIENQKSKIGKHAPKLTTETCQIDFTKSIDDVYNLIRGLSPYPTAFTTFEGKKLKIFFAKKVNEKPTILPGHFTTDKKTFLYFACADGFITVTDIQLEGKKRMDVESFLRGYRFS